MLESSDPVTMSLAALIAELLRWRGSQTTYRHGPIRRRPSCTIEIAHLLLYTNVSALVLHVYLI